MRTDNVASLGHVCTAAEEEGKAVLQEAKRRVEEAGFSPPETQLIYGSAKQQLYDYIAHEKFSLVLVASQGKGALKRFFVGSVCDYLIHNVDTPVLVIKPSKQDIAATDEAAS